MIDFDAIEEFDYHNATPEERAAYHEWVIKDQSLDEEEAEFERHFVEFVPAPKWVGERLRKAAKNPPVVHYSGKQVKKPVTLRMDVSDMDRIKRLAAEQGLQYQSLIGSILHRYAVGTLVDITEARKILTVR